MFDNFSVVHLINSMTFVFLLVMQTQKHSTLLIVVYIFLLRLWTYQFSHLCLYPHYNCHLACTPLCLGYPLSQHTHLANTPNSRVVSFQVILHTCGNTALDHVTPQCRSFNGSTLPIVKIPNPWVMKHVKKVFKSNN